VRAILDWEICTLGDPSPTSDSCSSTGLSPATRRRHCWAPPPPRPRLCEPDQVLKAYAAHSSLDVGEVAYYQAFGYWKLACILQGVFARYSAGATAGDQGSVAEFPIHIAMLAEMAQRTLEN